MFYHPGKSQLVLSKQQLRNRSRRTSPARPGCLGMKNMCPLSAGLCLKFAVEPVTLKTEDKLNAPSL